MLNYDVNCNRHNYIVVSWDGDEARKLMCSNCLKTISYKEVKFLNKKEATIVYDTENDNQE